MRRIFDEYLAGRTSRAIAIDLDGKCYKAVEPMTAPDLFALTPEIILAQVAAA